MTTPPTWSDGCWPRPDEWREWFLSLDAPAQYEAAALVVANAQTAAACTTQGHQSPADVDVLRQAAYSKGWNDHAAERFTTRREAEHP